MHRRFRCSGHSAAGWHRSGRVAALLAPLMMAIAAPGFAGDDRPRVVIATSHGDIEVELKPDQAPATVENFLRYVDEGFYGQTIFHRVIPGFMIQGGGLDEDLRQLDTHDPIVNESDNGLSNERGTIAMARTQVPDSATSQFFINHGDNRNLDGGSQPGYAVFGRVTDGMDVVDRIADVATGSRSGHRDVPRETVDIQSITRVTSADE